MGEWGDAAERDAAPIGVVRVSVAASGRMTSQRLEAIGAEPRLVVGVDAGRTFSVGDALSVTARRQSVDARTTRALDAASGRRWVFVVVMRRRNGQQWANAGRTIGTRRSTTGRQFAQRIATLVILLLLQPSSAAAGFILFLLDLFDGQSVVGTAGHGASTAQRFEKQFAKRRTSFSRFGRLVDGRRIER